MLTRRTFLARTAMAAGVAALQPWELLKAGASEARLAQMVTPGEAPFDTVVVLMMENRSFDHLLGWLPQADGRQEGLRYPDLDGHKHPTHDLGPDFTGCGNIDPDHSWYGGLVEFNGGENDGWLKTPPGRKVDDVYPIGYYTEQAVPVLGALARSYTALDGYFAAIMAETYPNRLYMHAAQTDRDHNLNPPGFGKPPNKLATMPTIWDRVAAAGLSGRYYYNDLPFVGLWGTKYLPIVAPFARFLVDAAAGTLPNVAFVDPKFSNIGGAESDEHPFADVRVGDNFIASVFHAVRTSPQWDRTVLVVTYDEWGGFFDHVPPPKVADDTDPNSVDHTCNVPGTCSEPPGLVPDYRQLGFRVPTVVVSPFSSGRVAHGGPYEHTSILKMIEWRWGLEPLTTRDREARNLVEVLDFDDANDTADGDIPGPVTFVPQTCGGPVTGF
jgi:phospholipase C